MIVVRLFNGLMVVVLRCFQSPDLPESMQAGWKSIFMSSPDDCQLCKSSGDDDDIEFKPACMLAGRSGDLNYRKVKTSKLYYYLKRFKPVGGYPPLEGVKGRITLVLLFLFSINTYAHEIRPAYLEIKQTTETSYQVLWKIPLLGNKAPRIDPILPDNFTLKQIDDEFLPDAYIRKYEGIYTEGLNGKEIAIKGLDLTLVDVLVQINLLDESSYTLLLQPDKAQAVIPKEPNKWEVIQLYILLGIEHILIGIDHLLFVLGLLLLVKGIKPLIQTITAFTLAHSITLGAATFDLIKVPQAPVEAVIALSIVFLAKEYISLKEGKESLTAKHPWIVAFTFGLLHGFGFAGALSEIGFPQKEVPLALFTFNVGVELGQLIFIGIIMILWQVLKKINLPHPKWTWKILPYAMGIMASFWLVERVVAFW